MPTLIFLLLAAAALGSATLVVLEKNPVYSVLYLVLTMVSLALFYVTLDAPFLAAIQMIVYAGAIMVLFLFMVMLLDLRKQEKPQSKLPLQKVFAPILLGLLLAATGLSMMKGQTARTLEKVTAAQAGNTEQLGHLLFGPWSYTLEVTSVLLLAAIVGAVVLAKRS